MSPKRSDICHIFSLIFFLLLLAQSPLRAQADLDPSTMSQQEKALLMQAQEATKESRQRKNKYIYGYIDRKHKMSENLMHIAAMYGVTWAVYPLSQPDVFKEKGSWKNYRKNFGQLVFDKDEPFWNWFVHPISGSQLYLYYRANGYSRIDSMGMAFISSTLFEFTVEIYTEPASIQDLYQTPVLGSFLGVGLENLSMYLLNSGNAFARTIGHIINPTTLFWFYEGKVQVLPQTNFQDRHSLMIRVGF